MRRAPGFGLQYALEGEYGEARIDAGNGGVCDAGGFGSVGGFGGAGGGRDASSSVSPCDLRQPGEELPPILGKDQLWGENDSFRFRPHAYELAAKIQTVIYQLPCYCYCDRMGHKSLHSCFEGTHGAQCTTCMKELYYAYQMTKQNKTAAQIRKGIIAGEWRQVDLQSAAEIN